MEISSVELVAGLELMLLVFAARVELLASLSSFAEEAVLSGGVMRGGGGEMRSGAGVVEGDGKSTDEVSKVFNGGDEGGEGGGEEGGEGGGEEVGE